MYSLPGWFWSLPFPPSKIHPGSCPTENSRLLSPFVLFASSPSINAYSAAPLQCLVPPIVRPPSSVRRRATETVMQKVFANKQLMKNTHFNLHGLRSIFNRSNYFQPNPNKKKSYSQTKDTSPQVHHQPPLSNKDATTH